MFRKSSTKCPSGHIGGSFHQHAELLFRIFLLWFKNQKQSWFLLEKTFFLGVFLCNAELNFDKPAKKTDKIPRIFRSNSENSYTNNYLPQKKHYMGKPFRSHRLHVDSPAVWSHRMPLSQPCQNLSIRGRKMLFQLLKIIMRLMKYSKNVAPNVPLDA